MVILPYWEVTNIWQLLEEEKSGFSKCVAPHNSSVGIWASMSLEATLIWLLGLLKIEEGGHEVGMEYSV